MFNFCGIQFCGLRFPSVPVIYINNSPIPVSHFYTVLTKIKVHKTTNYKT